MLGLKISAHCSKRMQSRGITRQQIQKTIQVSASELIDKETGASVFYDPKERLFVLVRERVILTAYYQAPRTRPAARQHNYGHRSKPDRRLPYRREKFKWSEIES